MGSKARAKTELGTEAQTFFVGEADNLYRERQTLAALMQALETGQGDHHPQDIAALHHDRCCVFHLISYHR